MTGKIKRRSLRCGGRPKADFGSIFTTFIAPALGVAGSVADSAISKAQVSKSNIKPAVKETKTEVTNNNTSVENLPTTQAPTKEPISGLITSNTVIPPDPTKTPAMRLGGRKKCWIGAAIMGATSIAGSLFGAAAQKREMRRQKNIQDWQNTTQEAANMTSTLNNSQDYQEDYLRQFRTAARLGKTLGAKGIYITDGGDATKIDNNTYLLRGGSHEDVNETGQTGIGINVGGNEVEAEGGEVAQKKNGALRIFSAQPILGNGMSPAQAILRGYNKDKVFSQQQAFKKRNGLKDDGSKARNGGYYDWARNTSSNLGISFIDPTYDYRAYYNSITPYERNLIRFAPQGTHFTDIGKTTKHPTFSNESKYSNKKTPGGTWNGNVFVPAIWQFGNNGNDKRNKYMKGSGEGYFDGRKNVYPKRFGGLTSKDRGSSKHPYPSVSSKDFAGGGRSYPIPTKADAVDALRLAGLHGRSDVKSKVYSRYPELRKKADFGTIVPGGIPGTDSYKQRMRSGYNVSPLDLLNVLNYLDRAAGFVDENGNSKYITGIAPTPGIRGRAKILNDLNRTNKVARSASASKYFNSRQYHIQPRRTRVSETAIPVEQYNNGRYTYQGQFNKWQQGSPYSQIGYPNSHITVSTEPNDVVNGNVGSWWSDFKTRIDLKSQAKQKRNNINLNNRLRKQEAIDRLRRIKAASKQSKFTNSLNSYSNEQLGAMRPDSYWDKQMGRFINLSDKVANVKETGKYALTAGAIGAGASLYGLSRIKSDNNINNNNNNNVIQKDAKGKPISPYIAKPTNNNATSNKQTTVKKQVIAKSSTIRKPIVVSKSSKPVSKKLYGLNDNETKVINGQTYVRRGNQVFNTTTKVRYDYSNGKYTGHNKVYGVGDYSHVGKNFNDAFDAARAAGASRFKYNAGKYNQYTTL